MTDITKKYDEEYDDEWDSDGSFYVNTIDADLGFLDAVFEKEPETNIKNLLDANGKLKESYAPFY